MASFYSPSKFLNRQKFQQNITTFGWSWNGCVLMIKPWICPSLKDQWLLGHITLAEYLQNFAVWPWEHAFLIWKGLGIHRYRCRASSWCLTMINIKYFMFTCLCKEWWTPPKRFRYSNHGKISLIHINILSLERDSERCYIPARKRHAGKL